MTAVDVDALDKLREGNWSSAYDRWQAEPREFPGHGRRLAFRAGWEASCLVDLVNALPDLLAEVRRGRALREAVEKLVAFYDRHEYSTLSTLNVDDLRAALAAEGGSDGQD